MSKLKLPTLLAVTDNPAVRFWIKKHLEEDFFIIDASKKHAALTTAHTTAFDFVIVDSELEDCDPIELCRELNQILRTLTPILLITGRLKKSYLNAAREAGATDFLSNQLDPEELQTRVAAIRKGLSLREKTFDASSVLPTLKGSSDTFLKNRVLVQNQALQVLKEAKKEGATMTALIVQIDRFQDLQDQFGDAISETILVPFANLVSRLLAKTTDRLFPSTEGRFIVLLKNRTVDQGRALADAIKKEIHSLSAKLTVSIVVSSLEGTESNFNRMLDSSVKALKKAQDLIITEEL